MKLQNKVGTKAYNKIAYGATKTQKKTEPMKRLNKHKYLQCLVLFPSLNYYRIYPCFDFAFLHLFFISVSCQGSMSN